MLRWLRSIFEQIPLDRCDVLFLCSSYVDEIWIRSTARACRQKGLAVQVVIADDGGTVADTITAVHRLSDVPVQFSVPFDEAAKVRCGALVTASSGLNRAIIPTKARHFIHMPHSLVSLHMVYPADAFDGYDQLFACGPHHEHEFKKLSAIKGLGDRPVAQVGYGKLDVLREAQARLQSNEEDQLESAQHILIAPSWGPDNLLDRCGPDLMYALAEAGFRVTVRPHPLFILEQEPVLADIISVVERCHRCEIESPLERDGALLEADLLIGDYSGTSFEFAALRERPVLSVDVGRKEVNPDWRALGIEPVEVGLRASIGTVVSPDVDNIVASSKRLLADNGARQSVRESLKAFLYEPGQPCGDRAATILTQLLSN